MASRSGLKAFLKLSFYEVLGVSEDADAEELKKAYHQKALEHHPDKNLEDANANARFTRVNEAFEASGPTLRDKDRRADYDLSRTAQSPPPTGASTGFAYRAPPNRPSNAGEQRRGHYTSPSNDPAHSWLMPLYAFLSIIAILVGELIGFFTSGSRLPSPISRFNPSRLARLYPGPVRERSATIQDILAFLQALSKNGPLSLEPGPMNWFSVYANFFECIAIEEKFHGSTILSTPRLGDFLTPRNEIDLFYRFWRNFETVKDFTWMSFHQVPPAHLATPLGRAQAEYENHMGRQFRKQEFEGLIRVIAEKLQEGDPRLRSYQRPFAQPKNASKAPKGKGNSNNKKKAKKRRR